MIIRQQLALPPVIALMYEMGSMPSGRKDTRIAFEWMKKGAERGGFIGAIESRSLL